MAVINATFSVDSFFLMSGMLATYNILKLLDKTEGKLNVPMFYTYRYLRLTPTYAILIGISATLLTYTGNGPYWYFVQAGEEFCRKNWWTNILYVNNLVRTEEMVNMNKTAILPLVLNLFFGFVVSIFFSNNTLW